MGSNLTGPLTLQCQNLVVCSALLRHLQKNFLTNRRYNLIIVTGASRDLGKAIAQHLTDKGEKVIGLARSIDNTSIKSIKCDVRDYSSVKNAAQQVKK